MQVTRRTSIFCAVLQTDPALTGDICDNSLSVGDIYVHDKETRPLYVKFTMSFLMSSVFLGLKNSLSNKVNSLHAVISFGGRAGKSRGAYRAGCCCPGCGQPLPWAGGSRSGVCNDCTVSLLLQGSSPAGWPVPMAVWCCP